MTSPEGPNDLELALEPNANPAGKAFRARCSSRVFRWLPLRWPTSQESSGDCLAHGVAFTKEPTPAGPITLAVFADTCGNLIQIYQPVQEHQ